MADILNVGAIAQRAFTDQFSFMEGIKNDRMQLAQDAIMNQFKMQQQQAQMELAQQQEQRMRDNLDLDTWKAKTQPAEQAAARAAARQRRLDVIMSLPAEDVARITGRQPHELGAVLSMLGDDEEEKAVLELSKMALANDYKISDDARDQANKLQLQRQRGQGGGGGSSIAKPAKNADGTYSLGNVPAKELDKLKARVTGLVKEFYQESETTNEYNEVSKRRTSPTVPLGEYLARTMSPQDIAILAHYGDLPSGVLDPGVYQVAQAYANLGEEYGASVYHALMDAEDKMYDGSGTPAPDKPAAGQTKPKAKKVISKAIYAAAAARAKAANAGSADDFFNEKYGVGGWSKGA